MPIIGLCLSGCGMSDGSEIHESVIAALEIDRSNATIKYMALNINQQKVMNHFDNKQMNEKRNILIESARIARGDISDLANISANDMDALIFPGGFGAVLNLCDFAEVGADCDIQPDVQRIILEMIDQSKPIGVICIAPAMMARALKGKELHCSLTIGEDIETANQIELLGVSHVNCSVGEITVDENLKIVSTPAYMLANRISETATGIEKLVKKVIELI